MATVTGALAYLCIRRAFAPTNISAGRRSNAMLCVPPCVRPRTSFLQYRVGGFEQQHMQRNMQHAACNMQHATRFPRIQGGWLRGFPPNDKLARSVILSEAELEYYATQFKRSGFYGPLCWCDLHLGASLYESYVHSLQAARRAGDYCEVGVLAVLSSGAKAFSQPLR